MCLTLLCRKDTKKKYAVELREVAMVGQPHDAEAAPPKQAFPKANLPERNFSKEDCDNPQLLYQHNSKVSRNYRSTLRLLASIHSWCHVRGAIVCTQEEKTEDVSKISMKILTRHKICIAIFESSKSQQVSFTDKKNQTTHSH